MSRERSNIWNLAQVWVWKSWALSSLAMCQSIVSLPPQILSSSPVFCWSRSPSWNPSLLAGVLTRHRPWEYPITRIWNLPSVLPDAAYKLKFHLKPHSMKYHWILSKSPWAAVAECHRLDALNNRNVFLTVLEAGKFKIRVPAFLVSGKSSLPHLFLDTFSVHPHMEESEWEQILWCFLL